MSRTERITFPGAGGDSLAGRLVHPTGPTRAWALFAHCFTCGKDLSAARRISDALAARGVAVLRFDFTGLGESEGDFAETTFSSNVDDLVAAAGWLRTSHGAPSILIGHSLGGAAVLAAARRIDEAKAVATIGAPSDPVHVRKLIDDAAPDLEERGESEVVLAGRRFRIKQAFLDDLAAQEQSERIGELRRALLVLHAPLDSIVGIDNARQIFVAAKHPKSFISLDGADHLLSRREDGEYVGDVIAAWAARYLPPLELEAEHGVVEVVGTRARYRTSIQAGAHHLIADEPRSVGGTDSGPGPYEFLLGGLGACTTMTLRMYADRKGWPLEDARVRLTHRKVHAKDCEDCETGQGRVDEIERAITLEGDLDDDQRKRLMEIADRCPVHRTLEGEIKVRNPPGESMTRCLLLLFVVLALAGCRGAEPATDAVDRSEGARYPAHWWEPVPESEKEWWEVLPQAAGPGEVILSKRNELGQLSNFTAAPFDYRGKRYASLEGFWQCMKYPEGPDDPRAKHPGLTWEHTREEVMNMVAFEAHSAGVKAEENMKTMGIDWISFEGEQIRFKGEDQARHYELIEAATRAKVRQNPKVKEVVLATGDLILKPDHVQEDDATPAWRYFDIYMKVRAELQAKTAPGN